jgi:hypothetical protein
MSYNSGGMGHAQLTTKSSIQVPVCDMKKELSIEST